MRYLALILAVALCVTPKVATAQMSVSATQIHLGDWILTPILAAPAPPGALAHVHSFLALLDKDTVTGNNITSIWYIRGADDNSAWQAMAWDSQSQWDAIYRLKLDLGIGDEWDSRWATKDPKPGTPPASPPSPVEYIKGVFTTDPLAGMIALMVDRDELVEILVNLGYKAADVPLEKALVVGECQDRYVLTSFAKTIEGVEASATSSVADGVAAGHAYLATKCAAICFPYVTVGPWVPTSPITWTPAPWVFIFCTPTVGGCSSCNYTAEVCRGVTRTWTFTWPNCSVSTYIDNAFECWTQSLLCLNPAGGGCPAAPACAAPPLGAPPPGTPTYINN